MAQRRAVHGASHDDADRDGDAEADGGSASDAGIVVVAIVITVAVGIAVVFVADDALSSSHHGHPRTNATAIRSCYRS